MAGTYLNFPFDEELFLMSWRAAIDPVSTAMLTSGALVEDSTVRTMIANGSNVYTIPVYDVLGGDEVNYDGKTDITVTETSGHTQSGVVYGRAKAWKDRDFIRDFNSGANPMASIIAQTTNYWNKKKQARLVSILKAVFATTAASETEYATDWANHKTNIAVATNTEPTDANKLDLVSLTEAMQKANGDNAGVYSLAIMHSRVATNLAIKELLEYRKYTDASGVERTVGIADMNGLTVIVNDNVPAVASTAYTGATEYTTYLFGTGALLTAPAPVTSAVEMGREGLSQGGYDFIINRLRETIHPNGFSFVGDVSTNVSPTDTVLGTATNWKLVTDPKLMAMAQIVSNG